MKHGPAVLNVASSSSPTCGTEPQELKPNAPGITSVCMHRGLGVPLINAVFSRAMIEDTEGTMLRATRLPGSPKAGQFKPGKEMLKELSSIGLTQPVGPWVYQHNPGEAFTKLNRGSEPVEGAVQAPARSQRSRPEGMQSDAEELTPDSSCSRWCLAGWSEPGWSHEGQGRLEDG